jgi:hypothetical protein
VKDVGNLAFVSLPELALGGAVILLLPHFSPRRYCFGVTAAPEFHSLDAARAALQRYPWHVAL